MASAEPFDDRVAIDVEQRAIGEHDFRTAIVRSYAIAIEEQSGPRDRFGDAFVIEIDAALDMSQGGGRCVGGGILSECRGRQAHKEDRQTQTTDLSAHEAPSFCRLAMRSIARSTESADGRR
jgi:hypothetical protein